MTPEPPRFPALDAEEAHLRQSLLGALCGLSVDDQLLRAQLLPRGADAAWFRCADAIAFRPLRLGGCALSMDASDGPAMAALLDAADDLLSAIEAALGVTLDPIDIGPCPDAAGLTVQIDSLDQKILLLLSVPLDAAILAQPAPLAPSLLGHIAVPVGIAVAGPRLSPADAATLAPGDLLLIGPAPIAATLRPPHGDAVPGRLDPVARCFRPH